MIVRLYPLDDVTGFVDRHPLVDQLHSNPVLLDDTTGNGSRSSLDASRIQQQVVGLPVDSFPDLPDTPISDPLG